MSRVLILGGGVFQINLIRLAVEMGHIVHVSDMNTHCLAAQEPGVTFHPYGLSDLEHLDDLVAKEHFDAVIPLNEVGARTASVLSHKYGLLGNSIEAINLATNKGLVRERMRQQGLPGPRVIRYESPEQVTDKLGYPCVVKPVSGQGSFGVSVVQREEDLRSAVERARECVGKDASLIIEEYLVGPQYSIETISSGGKHAVVALVRQWQTPLPVHFARVSEIDVAENVRLWEQANLFITSLLNAMNIEVGPCHIEVRLTKDGFRLIELNPRLGGGRLLLLAWADGVNYSELILRSYLEANLNLDPVVLPSQDALMGFVYSRSDERILRQLKREGQIDQIHSEKPLADKPATSLSDYSTIFYSAQLTSDDLFRAGYTLEAGG